MKRTRIDSKSQTPVKAQPDCLGSLFPKLDAVFVQLAQGESPNVLEMMAAIEDLVAFSTEGDTNPNFEVPDRCFRSQKNCRFCD